MSRHLFQTILFLLYCVLGNFQTIAQSKKEPLSFNDVRQWRTHSITLSDNGEWYTKLYSLFDKPESEKDTITEQKLENYFDDNNQTDILYICNSKDGIKYKIPDGRRPAFSSASDWVAYQIIPKPKKDKSKKDKEEETFIELKHLKSGFTVKYKSSAKYQFLDGKNYFITSDKKSLLIYDLNHRREHYIGNIGEYVINKKSDYIAYTINSKDNRGNGIYLYNPKLMTTKAVETSNKVYSNLSWNHDNTKLAAYKYQLLDDEVDYINMEINVFSALDSNSVKSDKYAVKGIKELPELMGPATKSGAIGWSKDNERLFLKLKTYPAKEDEKNKSKKDDQEASTVQVWHWKDKKLLSERIMEYDDKQNEVYEAIFFRNTNTLAQLTGEEIQKLIRSEGTDQWAIGTDNREYISDWDIYKNDLYRINLKTGDKKLIEKEYRSRYSTGIEISPDGDNAILWDGANYWSYDFEKGTKENISNEISFIDKEYDKFGYSPNYGFVGWVKNQNAVIVNHKLDLWLLPLDKNEKAQNLTSELTSKDSIRFRFEDYSFAYEPEIEDRYIDFSKPNFLYAFNTQTKYAGYYNLQNGKLKKLIYGPNAYADPYRRYTITKSKNTDVIVFKKGDYQNFPEAYLTQSDFSRPKKITNTNPQQEHFKWGKRILIDYTNDDGVPLQGILSIPEDYKKGEKLPMIVYSYEKLSNGRYNYAIPYLNGATVPEMLYVSEGYLFLRPDIHFNVGTPHSDMHESIDAAIEKVIALGYVDEQKIGYEGFSFGGHCGMYMSTQNNKFAAIAAGAGVSNLVQGFNIDIVRDGSNEQDYYMTGQGRLGTDPTSNTEMYISESPVFNAATMNTPLLLFHGTADKVVQWEHSFGFYSILRYLQKPVVFLSYLDEGHGMRQENNRLDVQKRLKEYFDHYLKGATAKDWMIEELPYTPREKSKEKDKRSLPKWKQIQP
ncbi:prolyl oligopeptidase family serine peptidase [Winogradskyella sp.]|uniref:alpha/beta hydrolase family protein n=1 Tax=Winogradskyella sp. TaxID=1883156 RepID=UPI00262211F6|nr:prolyl oligopeptidase family serine peptidase [Winogradskyella sp.]